MKAAVLWRVAARNLLRQPWRTAVLLFSVAVLAGTLMFALAFGQRLEARLRTVAARLGADLVLVPAGTRGAAEDFLLENRATSFYMDAGVLEKLRAFPEVAQATPQTYVITMPGACCGDFDAQVIAYDPGSDFIVRPWLGRVLPRDPGPGEVVAGAEVASLLDALGTGSALLFGREFTVAGVLDRSGTALDRAVFVRDQDLRAVPDAPAPVRERRISAVFVRLRDGRDAFAVARKLEAALLEADVIPRSHLGGAVQGALGDVRAILAFLVGVLALLAFLLAWAVFALVAGERRREVGVLRALGATVGDVRRLLLLEAALAGGAGAFLGVVAGSTANVLLPGRFALVAGAPGPGVAALAVITLASFALAAAVCFLGALVPVSWLARGEPLAALRSGG